MSQPQGVFVRPGDHVRVDRGPYRHHGVAVPAHGPAPNRAVRRLARQAMSRREQDEIELWSVLAVDGLLVDVVHYVKGDGSGKGVLARTGLADFVEASGNVEVLLATDAGLLAPDETVHRALAHVGKGGYSLAGLPQLVGPRASPNPV